jgi:hypothetical protein
VTVKALFTRCHGIDRIVLYHTVISLLLFLSVGSSFAGNDSSFPLNQTDHYCLLTDVEKNSTAHEALFNATLINHAGSSGPEEIWQVLCNADDAIVILKLAHDFCPQAVWDIREGINLST